MADLLHHEAAGGIVLIGSAILALIVANSAIATTYEAILHAYIGGLSVLHWINDGLMTLFFLLVGLEIKRELLAGELRTWSDRALPGAAAVGGMVVPALIYVLCNLGSPATLSGWAIPAATDIAFALGILLLLGSRVPVSLKLFLTTLAILDDLGAVAIIAVFYTAQLSLPMLALSAVLVGILFGMSRLGVTKLWPYVAVGAVVWSCVLQSGVHATVAGVVVAATIPLTNGSESPLRRLEHALHPWCAFLVLPVFGFANAGVSLAGLGIAMLVEPVTLGIMLGLFLGKQIGVVGGVWVATRLGIARTPAGAGWMQIYGVALLCGVGFTMSLFIGLLAFGDAKALEAPTKIGVLAGSLLSTIAGSAVLLRAPNRTRS